MDERKLSLLDVVIAPETPGGGSDSKFFEARCESMAIRALVEGGTAEYILQRPNHPAYIRVLEFVTERSKGKVPDLIRNEHIINPAVALPAKNPEFIPYVESEVVSEQQEAGQSSDSLDASPGTAE